MTTYTLHMFFEDGTSEHIEYKKYRDADEQVKWYEELLEDEERGLPGIEDWYITEHIRC